MVIPCPPYSALSIRSRLPTPEVKPAGIIRHYLTQLIADPKHHPPPSHQIPVETRYKPASIDNQNKARTMERVR
jgi:hypothetical protein